MDRKCNPFWRQVFAVMGVLLNTMPYGFVNTFISVLLPQLRSSKYIVLDMDQESWIVSTSSIANIAGMVLVPIAMDKYGRRIANLMSASLMSASWFAINLASSYYWMLVIRFLQGMSLGMMMIMSTVLIGEYSSPKYRGAFLSMYPLAVAVGVLLMHTLGSFMSWWTVSLVCGVIGLLDMLIIYLSPESPSFFARCGRYEECRAAFHWLRGLDEDEELDKMIKANMARKSNVKNSSLSKFKTKCIYILEVMKKKEVYKPLILMCHMAIISEWSAGNILDVYTMDVFEKIVDKSMNMPAAIISVDIQRLVTNFVAIFVIRYVKRRVMVLRMISSNVAAFILIAAYVYARDHGILPYDHPIIGILLLHLHAFTMAMGNSPLAIVIAGEVYPLEYRSMCNMWAFMFYTLNVIINMKTVLLAFATIGLEGAYCVYAGIVAYGLVVTMILLPETKDKSLQDIEEEFRGSPLIPVTEASVLVDQDHEKN